MEKEIKGGMNRKARKNGTTGNTGKRRNEEKNRPGDRTAGKTVKNRETGKLEDDMRRKEYGTGVRGTRGKKAENVKAGNKKAGDKKEESVKAGNKKVGDKKEGNKKAVSVKAGNGKTGKQVERLATEGYGKRTRAARRGGNYGVDDMCPYAKACGGCDYQGMDYKKQLQEKQEYVSRNVAKYCKVLPIIGMEQPYHYRNKVHAVFDIAKGVRAGKADGIRPGTIISGVYKAGTHDVVNIDTCQIEDETAAAIIRDIRGLLRSFKIKTYDEDTGYGLLRHVLVRRGFQSGEVMVVLVLGSPILPSKNNFVKAIRKLHPEITTIVININNKRTSMILGEKETVIYGKGYIEDTLCGCVFRISPKSFYQINPVQTEILYRKAIAYAGLTGNETIVDAYCGIGTIGLIAAAKAKEVISVEQNRDAVRDAVLNAKRNGISNVQFYNADAGEFMTEMAEYNAAHEEERKEVDVVFLDPPRAGSDEAFLDSVVRLAPKKVVYVSCNPETLERDLGYLTERGYRAVECQPIDLFPWTRHVECCVKLERREK